MTNRNFYLYRLEIPLIFESYIFIKFEFEFEFEFEFI